MNIICDLDGTIALDHKRNHFLHPVDGGKRDWDAYFDACHTDKPNRAVIEILHKFFLYNTIYILSGRSHIVLEKTLTWLVDHNVPYHRLQMRAIDDRTDDHILKIGWAKLFDLTPDNTLFVMEDRQRVVDAWRAQKFTVLQVASGNF